MEANRNQTKNQKVALVEDEKNVRLAVGTALKKCGFDVAEFSNGALAFEDLKAGSVPDIYVLDIMMPVMDGNEFLQKYRQIHPEIPAIFLTSRDEEFDKIQGLENGADDYLTKPFSMKELIARIKVILRRYDFLKKMAKDYLGKTQTATIVREPNNDTENNIILSGIEESRKMQTKNDFDKLNDIESQSKSISLDSESCTATLGGKNLPLTVTEFRLLEVFMKRAGTVLTRDQLLDAAYPEDVFQNDRAIDCHIKRLRKKIGADKIETVYGLGYKFVK